MFSFNLTQIKIFNWAAWLIRRSAQRRIFGQDPTCSDTVEHLVTIVAYDPADYCNQLLAQRWLRIKVESLFQVETHESSIMHLVKAKKRIGELVILEWIIVMITKRFRFNLFGPIRLHHRHNKRLTQCFSGSRSARIASGRRRRTGSRRAGWCEFERRTDCLDSRRGSGRKR